MILALDVHYEEHATNTACVGFAMWPDAHSTLETFERAESAPEPYEPGQFYKRELPHLRRTIEGVRRSTDVDAIVVDGHVWLNENHRGLGAHLYDALDAHIPIIGVAKSAFHGANAVSVLRGHSRRPLFITAVGIDASQAAAFIHSMHGPHRVPTLLKRADQLARRHVHARTENDASVSRSVRFRASPQR